MVCSCCEVGKNTAMPQFSQVGGKPRQPASAEARPQFQPVCGKQTPAGQQPLCIISQASCQSALLCRVQQDKSDNRLDLLTLNFQPCALPRKSQYIYSERIGNTDSNCQ
jgi:hypothetical protein